jgi:hypothetical protein
VKFVNPAGGIWHGALDSGFQAPVFKFVRLLTLRSLRSKA